MSGGQVKKYRPPAPHRREIEDIERRLVERFRSRSERTDRNQRSINSRQTTEQTDP